MGLMCNDVRSCVGTHTVHRVAYRGSNSHGGPWEPEETHGGGAQNL